MVQTSWDWSNKRLEMIAFCFPYVFTQRPGRFWNQGCEIHLTFWLICWHTGRQEWGKKPSHGHRKTFRETAWKNPRGRWVLESCLTKCFHNQDPRRVENFSIVSFLQKTHQNCILKESRELSDVFITSVTFVNKWLEFILKVAVEKKKSASQMPFSRLDFPNAAYPKH